MVSFPETIGLSGDETNRPTAKLKLKSHYLMNYDCPHLQVDMMGIVAELLGKEEGTLTQPY